MTIDAEGFLRPVINATKCIGCGLCARVCPVTKNRPPRQPLKVVAAVAKDLDLRVASSSGGAFTLLANKILSEGGKIYGAIWRDDWKVVHRGISNEADLAAMRGSKYLQSDVSNVFREIKSDLDSGRKVLFSGTPCQIAGLRSFLGCERPNLLSVELICHGVPSPDVWLKYLMEITGDTFEHISNISFRDKSIDGTTTALRITLADGSSTITKTNAFSLAFYCELCNRPSCHQCKFRSLKSGADLVLGDFSGLTTMQHNLDATKGVSLIIPCTSRGVAAFSEVEDMMNVHSLSYETAVAWNPNLEYSFPPHHFRPVFMKRFRTQNIASLVEQLTKVHGIKKRWLSTLAFFMRMGGAI